MGDSENSNDGFTIAGGRDFRSHPLMLNTLNKYQNTGLSGYNSITLNNCNYYESKHYRPHVGDMIAARIFLDKDKVVPDDFGVFVTKENIDKHIGKLNRKA